MDLIAEHRRELGVRDRFVADAEPKKPYFPEGMK